MAVPFRRTSKRSKRLRRTHFKLEANGLVTCPHCGATIKAHHVCPECGYYDGKAVLVNGKVPTNEVVKETKASKETGKKSVKKAKEAKTEETK